MKKFLQALSILTLMTWGGMFLYFYTSGRVEKYLDPSFRVYALVSGIGFLLLGAFNFLNRHRDAGVCTHDHAHGDACDHEHHAHDHEHREACDHDHGHHHHGAACEHDHKHEHTHVHGPDCDHAHHHHDGGACDHVNGDHDHGNTPEKTALVYHDHDESTSGVVFSLLVLLLPLLIATGYSRDSFSGDYLAKWGKIERQMMQMRIAKANPTDPAKVAEAGAMSNPYTREGIEAAKPTAADTPPKPDAASKEEPAAASWGTFTMEDLKKMVPQSSEGNFLLDVPQIFYTAGDKELMEVMEGIPVEATAQLMEETLNNPNKSRLKAFRLFIECCAADARPLSIPVDFGKAPPKYVEMGWYKLYGKLHYATEDGAIVPLINIERIESTTEPTDGLMF